MNEKRIRLSPSFSIRDLKKEISIFTRRVPQPKKIREVILSTSGEREKNRDFIIIKKKRVDRSFDQTHQNINIQIGQSPVPHPKIYKKPQKLYNQSTETVSHVSTSTQQVTYSQNTCPVARTPLPPTPASKFGTSTYNVSKGGIPSRRVQDNNITLISNISMSSIRSKSPQLTQLKEIEQKGVEMQFDPSNKSKPIDLVSFDSFTTIPNVCEEKKEKMKPNFLLKKDSILYSIYEKNKQKISDYLLANRNKKKKNNRNKSFDCAKRKRKFEEVDIEKRGERSVDKKEKRGGRVDLFLPPKKLHLTRNKRMKYFDIIRSIVTFGKYEFIRLFNLKKQLQKEVEGKHYLIKLVFIQRWWKEIYFRLCVNLNIMIIQKMYRGYKLRKKFNKEVENILMGEVLTNLEKFIFEKKVQNAFDKVRHHNGMKIFILKDETMKNWYLSKIHIGSNILTKIQVLQANIKRFLFQKKNIKLYITLETIKKLKKIKKRPFLKGYKLLLTKNTYINPLKYISFIQKKWRKHALACKKDQEQVFKKPRINPNIKKINFYQGNEKYCMVKKLLKPEFITKAISNKQNDKNQKGIKLKCHLFTKSNVNRLQYIHPILTIQRMFRLSNQSRKNNTNLNIDNSANINIDQTDTHSMTHSRLDSSSFTTKSSIIDKKQIIANIKLIQNKWTSYKAKKNNKTGNENLIIPLLIDSKYKDEKGTVITKIYKTIEKPVSLPFIHPMILNKVYVSNDCSKINYIEMKFRQFLFKKKNALSPLKIGNDYKKKPAYLIKKRVSPIKNDKMKIQKLAIKMNEVGFSIDNKIKQKPKLEQVHIQSNFIPNVTNDKESIDLFLKARNHTTSRKQINSKGNSISSNSKLRKMFISDIKNKLSFYFLKIYNQLKFFDMIYLLTQRITKNSQEYGYQEIKNQFSHSNVDFASSSLFCPQIKESFYISTLRRHLKVINDNEENDSKIGIKVKKLLISTLPKYFLSSHNKKVIPYINQYQRKKLEITNLYKESEEIEFGKYINLFLQKEQNFKKGSLNHLILNRLNRTKFDNTNIFTITKFIDELLEDVVKARYCQKCYCKRGENCKRCYCHQEDEEEQEPEFDVEENVVKVDEYQTEQNQLAIYTFTSEEDNDDDDTTINKKEGNNIVQPLATENTERKIFFSEKKDDSDDDFDVLSNINTKKNQLRLQEIDLAIKKVKGYQTSRDRDKSRDNETSRHCMTIDNSRDEKIIPIRNRSPLEVSRLRGKISKIFQKKKKNYLQLRDNSYENEKFS